MPKIRMARSIFHEGRILEEGQIVDLPEYHAISYVRGGFADYAVEPPETIEPPETDDDAPETIEPPETDDDRTETRVRRRKRQ